MSPAVPEFPPDIVEQVMGRADVRTRAKALGRPVELEARVCKYWEAQQDEMDKSVAAFKAVMQRYFEAQEAQVLEVAERVLSTLEGGVA